MRKWVLASLIVPIVIAGIWLGSSTPTTGQDQTDERLITLETRVATQAGEIANLKARVDALESTGSGQSDGASQPAGESVSLSGDGIVVTDKFSLAAGRYKVSGTVEVTTDFEGFAVFVYPPEGMADLVFNEIIEENGTWTGSSVFEADEDGEYYVEIQNISSPWTLTFERID